MAEGGGNLIFGPTAEGTLITDLLVRQSSWSSDPDISYPNTGWAGYYPGNASMQYLAATMASETLHFGAHDPSRITKELEYDGNDSMCPVEGSVLN